MPKLVWDLDTQRLYETGTKNGVLYPRLRDGTYPLGVAWNGLTGVTETPEGGEPNDFYADDMKYLTLLSAETFGGTITAYTFPDEWAECDGFVEYAEGLILNQQTRKPFGLCYRTVVGNDTEMNDFGYKLHLIYNALVSPSERGYTSVNDSPEPIEFSWDFTTTPIRIEGYKPLSLLTLDSTRMQPATLALIEKELYGGTGATEIPRLPLPNEIMSLAAMVPTYGVVTPAPGDNPSVGSSAYTTTIGSTTTQLGWYEQIGGTGTTYIRSLDPMVNPNKTYYYVQSFT